MAKEEQQQPKEVGFLDKIKGMFSGAGKGKWKIPAAVGIIAGIAVSGPFGFGVAGGVYAASQLKRDTTKGLSMVEKAKNGLLKTIGGITSGGCAAIGATIGSFMFPVVGTALGAVAGFLIGMVASRAVTNKVRNSFLDKKPRIPSGVPAPQARATPAKVRLKEKEQTLEQIKVVKPEVTPPVKKPSKGAEIS